MNIEKLMQELTLEEKAALVAGNEFWKTNPIPRLNIPSIFMSDGPHGLRKQNTDADNLGVNDSELCTCFPTAATVANSWNISNARVIGSAIADEALFYGANVVLGPGVNIKKNPLCGRNFEYYSEDPYLAGEFGAAWVSGVQDMGIGTSVKHFAANNYEDYRAMGDSVVDERTLREIYLKAFEKVVKQSKPYTVMSAYNQINEEFCAENKHLLTGILRDEWKFDGLVVSDWGGIQNRVKSIRAGLDLEMPGDCWYFRKSILEAVKQGQLSIEDLDGAVRNVLKLIQKFENINFTTEFDKNSHHNIAGNIAKDCAVLLKNNSGLPLNKNEEILVIGDLFAKMRYQGAGSSQINPTKLTTPQDAFNAMGIKYQFERGYNENTSEVDKQLLSLAVEASEKFNKVVVVCGLTDYFESEGYDRKTMQLPTNQIVLINELAKLKKEIILVLFGGSPVEMPFINEVNAVLNMYLPGQNGGQAAAELLFGQVNPSGKLAETWPLAYSDVPFYSEFSKSQIEVYKDNIYVGYRYYDKADKEVLFPFGYGLSYSTFKYSNIEIKETDKIIEVSCDIKNTGKLDGAEVAQLYVKNNTSLVHKADKELRAFDKVYLKSGETKKANFKFNRQDLSFYNVKQQKWVLEKGTYEILIGASSRNILLKSKIDIKGAESETVYNENISKVYNNLTNFEVSDEIFEQLIKKNIPLAPPVKPITMESRFIDYKKRFFGKIVYNMVIGVVTKQIKKADKLKDNAKKDSMFKSAVFMKRMMDASSMRFVLTAGGGRINYNMANGLVAFANGRLFKAIYLLLKKEKPLPLPKNSKV